MDNKDATKTHLTVENVVVNVVEEVNNDKKTVEPKEVFEELRRTVVLEKIRRISTTDSNYESFEDWKKSRLTKKPHTSTFKSSYSLQHK